ncbi:hypothetical protein OAM67_00030 [bacterium]|nr:hypothetical protein [bacterium]
MLTPSPKPNSESKPPTVAKYKSETKIVHIACITHNSNTSIPPIDPPAQNIKEPRGTQDNILRTKWTEACPELTYANEILKSWSETQHQHNINPIYIKKQKGINFKMRTILNDWLIEVALKFKLGTETLFLTNSIIDQYLTVKQCARRQLQLVGVTAMLIASKYEEIYFPEIRDFVYITAKTYTRKQILTTEHQIVQACDYSFTYPTLYHYLTLFYKLLALENNACVIVENLSWFVAHICLTDIRAVRMSATSLASLALACCVFGYAFVSYFSVSPHSHKLIRMKLKASSKEPGLTDKVCDVSVAVTIKNVECLMLWTRQYFRESFRAAGKKFVKGPIYHTNFVKFVDEQVHTESKIREKNDTIRQSVLFVFTQLQRTLDILQ